MWQFSGYISYKTNKQNFIIKVLLFFAEKIPDEPPNMLWPKCTTETQHDLEAECQNSHLQQLESSLITCYTFLF